VCSPTEGTSVRWAARRSGAPGSDPVTNSDPTGELRNNGPDGEFAYDPDRDLSTPVAGGGGSPGGGSSGGGSSSGGRSGGGSSGGGSGAQHNKSHPPVKVSRHVDISPDHPHYKDLANAYLKVAHDRGDRDLRTDRYQTLFELAYWSQVCGDHHDWCGGDFEGEVNNLSGSSDWTEPNLKIVIGAAFFSVAGISTARTVIDASNVANGVRLSGQLARESTTSVFTPTGRLTSGAIRDSTLIIEGVKLGNSDLVKILTADGSKIADWGKYTTRTHQNSFREFQVHYYMNRVSGTVNYTYDYKVVFKGPRG
jgi:hypothetical protein